MRTYVAERRSVQTIKDGDFDVPEFKKLEQESTVDRSANPFANNGAKPVETPPTDDLPVGFEEVDTDDCPF